MDCKKTNVRRGGGKKITQGVKKKKKIFQEAETKETHAYQSSGKLPPKVNAKRTRL